MAEKKVLVVVDVQNDFVKGGVLPYGFPSRDNTGDIEKAAKEAVEGGDYVFATRDTHHAGYHDTLEGRKLPVAHCIAGTKGWEFVPWLEELSHGKVFVVDKPTFGSTGLGKIIMEQCARDGNMIGEIRIAGYMTSICVLANAVLLRAQFPDTRISVMSGLCGDGDAESHHAALKVLGMQQVDVL